MMTTSNDFHSSERDAILSCVGVSKTFRQGNAILKVIDNVTVHFTKGITMLKGVSGSGKSTFLNLVTGIDVPDSGAIYINGELARYDDEARRSELHRNVVSIMFQHLWLNHYLTVEENLGLETESRGLDDGHATDDLMAQTLETFGLVPLLKEQLMYLSGGELQRVALAKAFLRNKPLLILDEPTSHLNHELKVQILSFIKDWLPKMETRAVLIASHDPIVERFADFVLPFPLKKGVNKLSTTAGSRSNY